MYSYNYIIIYIYIYIYIYIFLCSAYKCVFFSYLHNVNTFLVLIGCINFI